MNVVKFTFSPFQENTYVLYDDTKECIIIDAGCYDERERRRLTDFIEARQLTPVQLVNTHCHIDHIFGVAFLAARYNLPLTAHRDEASMIAYSELAAKNYGVKLDPPPPISVFLEEGDRVTFGNSELSVFFTPGHSPASLSFYSAKDGFVLSGDALFQGSIGRTDLPLGNFEQLIESIRTKLLTLPAETVVYSGHGDETTIGTEARYNPFLQ